jgi:hypothetical protein
MRLNVIVDREGNILGTAQVGIARLEDGTELEIGIVPEPGQTIHVVDVSDDVRELSPEEVHQRVSQSLGPRLPGRYHRGRQ